MEEKIKELEKQIAELKAELEKKTEFRVNKGDDYYYLSELGEIGRYEEDNDPADDYLYELGNYFKTEEEAETMAKKLKAIAKVSRAILIANGDWKPNWSDITELKWIIAREKTKNRFDIYYSNDTDNGLILPYIKTTEIAKQIMEDYEEELKIIFEIGVLYKLLI